MNRSQDNAEIPVSVIIPAHNEANYVGACLEALLASVTDGLALQVIVVANGCADDTAQVTRTFGDIAAQKGWFLKVIETRKAGKANALNIGDAAAKGARIYLDADTRLSPSLVSDLAKRLNTPLAAYASGTPCLAPARSFVSRAYGRFWITLPFVTRDTPGFGVFAMNETGRQRWGDWPEIISDDTFARLNFVPSERTTVSATYQWPLVEGFSNLVKVRRRQNRGVEQIAALYPELVKQNPSTKPSFPELIKLAAGKPLDFLAYAAVVFAVKLTARRNGGNDWTRGR